MSDLTETETTTVPNDQAVSVDEAASRRVVLFDFDGVLIQGDAFKLFLRARYRRAPWRFALAAMCLPLWLLLWPFSPRLSGLVLVRVALVGVSERRYREAASDFAALLARRSRQFCRDGLQALRRHQSAGDRVIVVTGCEDVLVTGILQQLGLTDLEVLASQLRPGGLGMRVHWHNVGVRKVQRLARHGVSHWAMAYTDSLQDVPMLKPAAQAVLVNGTPKLCKKFEKALGRAITRVEWY